MGARRKDCVEEFLGILVQTSYLVFVGTKHEDEDDATGVASLDLEKSRIFLRRLAEDPFLCIVVTDDVDTKVLIYSKGIDHEHIKRIHDVIREIREG